MNTTNLCAGYINVGQIVRSSCHGAGTIFGRGGRRWGKTGNAKLMGSLSNLDRVFDPEISVL